MPRRRVDPTCITRRSGKGAPILLIHPLGVDGLDLGPRGRGARPGWTGDHLRPPRVRAIRRRTGPQSLSTHSADAAALLESLQAPPAVVVGTSSGAMIALDLAVRRPDLVRAVVEHEGPWRFTRHLPTGSQVRTFATMGSLVLRGRHSDAAEALLRSAYAYREGGTAWDAFPEEWRRAGRENGKATLWDFLISIGNHPSAAELASIDVPVVCSYGSRSPDFMARRTQSLAAAIPTARIHRIEGAAHAAPFDAPANFAQLIADTVTVRDGDALSRR